MIGRAMTETEAKAVRDMCLRWGQEPGPSPLITLLTAMQEAIEQAALSPRDPPMRGQTSDLGWWL